VQGRPDLLRTATDGPTGLVEALTGALTEIRHFTCHLPCDQDKHRCAALDLTAGPPDMLLLPSAAVDRSAAAPSASLSFARAPTVLTHHADCCVVAASVSQEEGSLVA
jgi:hypothetical protein